MFLAKNRITSRERLQWANNIIERDRLNKPTICKVCNGSVFYKISPIKNIRNYFATLDCECENDRKIACTKIANQIVLSETGSLINTSDNSETVLYEDKYPGEFISLIIYSILDKIYHNDDAQKGIDEIGKIIEQEDDLDDDDLSWEEVVKYWIFCDRCESKYRMAIGEWSIDYAVQIEKEIDEYNIKYYCKTCSDTKRETTL